jgi:sulfate transport system substrate-binding protein
MKILQYILFVLLCALESAFAQNTLLNVSYDPTREFYSEINKSFIKDWGEKTGQEINIEMSHGGSGNQARAVIDGLEADVVTLALAYDIDNISQKSCLLPADWQKRLPNHSCPYTSTIVFVVRKGNPKHIKDWNDLVKKDISVITPNPKTSGGARWNYLAAWAYAEKEFNGDEKQIKAFVQAIYNNVPVLDRGARASTTTFIARHIGDVLLSWENEAFLIQKEFPGETEIITPSISILAEPPVAIIDKNADAHGTRKLAQTYLNYLYSDEGQTIAAKNFYRPQNEKIFKKYASQFPKIKLVTIDQTFGGWVQAQKIHFRDGGVFDQLYGK